jgi:hypothetical protein
MNLFRWKNYSKSIIAKNAARRIGTRFAGGKQNKIARPGTVKSVVNVEIGGSGIAKIAINVRMVSLQPVNIAGMLRESSISNIKYSVTE